MNPITTDQIQDSSRLRWNTLKKDERGQSTIEFVMTFAFVVMFLGVFVRFAINTTNGYIVHYVTYQASRVMLVADNNAASESSTDTASRTVARNMFKSYLPDFPLNKVRISHPTSIGEGPDSDNLFSGVRAEFELPFALAAMGGEQPLKLVSESFLGRIPPMGYCRKQVCKAIDIAIGTSDACSGEESKNITVVDNGC